MSILRLILTCLVLPFMALAMLFVLAVCAVVGLSIRR